MEFAMLKLIILTFFALTAIWGVSAQTETCTLKAEDAEVSLLPLVTDRGGGLMPIEAALLDVI
jgi:hypothetical protein